MKKFEYISILLLLLVSLSDCNKPADHIKQTQPSVLLVTIDTLRADFLGCYGNEQVRSPYIDKLSKRSLVFSQMTSQAPATGPSCASMLTSKYPAECGVLHSTMKLRDENITIAEVLKENGYLTAAFVSSSIVEARYGFSQGFKTFDDQFTHKYSDKEYERDSQDTIRAAKAWIKDHRDRSFFVWLHLFDPHTPYKKHSPMQIPDIAGDLNFILQLENEKNANKLAIVLPEMKKLYAEEIQHVDRNLGLLLRSLIDYRSKKYIIALTADHGEELYDHFFYHGHFLVLTQSVLNVPFILKLPVKPCKGRICEEPAANIDIVPTILETLKITAPPDMRGTNLFPRSNPENKVETRYIFSQREPYSWIEGGSGFALRDNNWKYVYFTQAPHELYHLALDPAEKSNVINRYDNIVKRFAHKLDVIMKHGDGTDVSINSTDLDYRSREALKSLGYLK